MIDIKELRIGSHYYNTIYVKPVIGRVTSISGKDRVSLFYDMPYDPENDPYEGAMVHDLEPIPLTAGLLEELGFECLEQRDSVSVWSRSGIHIEKWGEQTAIKLSSVLGLTIRCLHELEDFVYLATKTELIKED